MEWIELNKDIYERLMDRKYRYFIREYVGNVRDEKIFRVHFFKTEKQAFIRQTELRITNSDCWRQRMNRDSIEMFLGVDQCRFYLNPRILSEQ